MSSILATGTTTVVDSTAWTQVLDALTAQISVPAVVGVLAATITAGIGLVFMWWGVRKLSYNLMDAFRNGKFRV